MPEEERGRSGHTLETSMSTGAFILSVFICFLKAKILGEISEEDLNRIFISSLGMSFNMLIHQNKHIKGYESFSGQFHLQRMPPKRDQDQRGSAPAQSGMCKPFALKCP